MTNNTIFQACQNASLAWLAAFNRGDAKACAEQYSEDCEMHARPFGVFKGRPAIQAFWQGLMDEGYKHVTYSHVEWLPAKDGFMLTAQWQMNKASGVIHKEYWVLESDGKARLHSDDFEVTY